MRLSNLILSEDFQIKAITVIPSDGFLNSQNYVSSNDSQTAVSQNICFLP